MNCPKCGAADYYAGLNICECSNPACVDHKPSAFPPAKEMTETITVEPGAPVQSALSADVVFSCAYTFTGLHVSASEPMKAEKPEHVTTIPAPGFGDWLIAIGKKVNEGRTGIVTYSYSKERGDVRHCLSFVFVDNNSEK